MGETTSAGAAAGQVRTGGGGAGANLALATAAFAITFWAWNLIGPLASSYARQLGLSPSQASMLIAIPVLVGSVGRIPVGALTDRLGGRTMFAVICFASIVPVLAVGFSDSYGWLLFWGFVLGVAGTSFAVGIPFANAWFSPSRRGMATGVFGAGMGGTALSAFFTPRLVESLGRTQTHVWMAVALAAMGVIMLLFARNAPSWKPGGGSVVAGMRAAMRLTATWQCAALYAVAFGGFVAFSTYLPTLLQTVYDFAQTEAGMRTAGFSLAAVIARPIGGTLSDRVGPVRVLVAAFAVTTVMALVLTLTPPPELAAGATYVIIAFALGLGTGGVFALVAKLVRPSEVGTVTGFVGASGGLGGYFPPLVMGGVYQLTGAYTIGFVLLAVTAAVATVYVLRLRTEGTGAGARPAG